MKLWVGEQSVFKNQCLIFTTHDKTWNGVSTKGVISSLCVMQEPCYIKHQLLTFIVHYMLYIFIGLAYNFEI